MDGALLMTHKHGVEVVIVVIESIEDRHDGTAGITEYLFGSFSLETLKENF